MRYINKIIEAALIGKAESMNWTQLPSADDDASVLFFCAVADTMKIAGIKKGPLNF